MNFKSLIRTIPNYPKPGIMFRDITTLLQDDLGFNELINKLVEVSPRDQVDVIAGIEARGFIIGSAIAHRLSKGFIPLRKMGKLPGKTVGVDYDLEYGSDRIEIHVDAINKNQNVLLVDDLIATGGTALAAIELLDIVGANILGCLFVIDLPDLGGTKRIEERGITVQSLVEFEGD